MLIGTDTTRRMLKVASPRPEGVEFDVHAMDARAKNMSWQRTGVLLGMSAQAAQQRCGAVIEAG